MLCLLRWLCLFFNVVRRLVDVWLKLVLISFTESRCNQLLIADYDTAPPIKIRGFTHAILLSGKLILKCFSVGRPRRFKPGTFSARLHIPQGQQLIASPDAAMAHWITTILLKKQTRVLMAVAKWSS